MVMTLYAAPTSNCRRVELVLLELGLPFCVRTVDRAAGEQHGAAFRAINPTGMVPVLVDPSGPRDSSGAPVPITQSGAILIYLAEKSGRLLPDATANRTATLQWLMHVLTDVNATASALFHARRVSAGHECEVTQMLAQRLHVYLRDCCTPLETRCFIAGDLSVADFALYPLVVSQRQFIEARADLHALLTWQQRMADLPSVRAASLGW